MIQGLHRSLEVLEFDSFVEKYFEFNVSLKNTQKVLEFSILSWNSAMLERDVKRKRSKELECEFQVQSNLC